MEKAYVYRNGDFLGCVEVTESDWNACPEDFQNWHRAALIAAERVYGPGVYHVTSRPNE